MPSAGVNIVQPDVTLTLDAEAVIREATVANLVSSEVLKPWLGRLWVETVADSGVEKVRRSLDDARTSGVSAFQLILQRFPSGLELPIEYTTVRLGEGGGLIAIGRSLQASSELQSRLLAAQQAMERDYWKLREVETRYRLLFDASSEAVLLLNADDLKVADSNPAAIRALGLTHGWDFLNEIAPREREGFRDMLARARESGRAPGAVFHIGAGQTPWILRATLTVDPSGAIYMVQLVPAGSGMRTIAPPAAPPPQADLVDQITDGFVAIDRNGAVRRANRAFLELAQVGAEDAVLGRPLERWLRGADASLANVTSGRRAADAPNLFIAKIEGERGAMVDVEASVGGGDGVGEALLFGVVLRDIRGRAAVEGLANDLPALPRLGDSAAKTPLKALVHSAVAVVERHYVESALRKTGGNRTAAAEILGLSRQSLYAKLNRYSLDRD